MTWWQIALGYGLVAYAYDVLYRPSQVRKLAEQAARGKPVLNVGAGHPTSSLRAAVFGPQLYGDVNCDYAAPQACSLDRQEVCHCDAHELPFPDKHFGAAIASHVIEHVSDPAAAMSELHRVADHVFVIVPKWWAPHTWLHPGHKWFISDAGVVYPLWK